MLHQRFSKVLVMSFALFMIFLLYPSLSSCKTLSVTNLNDSGAGSLRRSVLSASPGDVIECDVNGTIVLTSGEILISNNIQIKGPGADLLMVSGNNNSRIFKITGLSSVDISGISLINGYHNDKGGAVYNSSDNFRITNCKIISNLASSGGGIYNYKAQALIKNCFFQMNNCSSSGSGGAIHNEQSDLAIEGCSFQSNQATHGGALFNSWNSSPCIQNCTFTSNSAKYGGAVKNVTSSGSYLNCTYFNNTASIDGSSFYNLSSSNTEITNCLFWDECGKEIYNSNSTSSLNNCIIRSNSILGDEVSGLYIDDITSQDLHLGPLQDNGGPTPTCALGEESIAIDAGVSLENLSTDQRGYPRPWPLGGSFDIGAYEVVKHNITSGSDAGGTISPNGEAEVLHGEDQTFTITAEEHYHIDQVLVDSAPVDLEGDISSLSYTFSDVISEHSISVDFALDQHDLIISILGTGNGSVDPTGGSYPYGSEVEIHACPATDSFFSGWGGDAAGNSSSTMISMNSDKSVIAEFELIPEISISADNLVTEDQGNFNIKLFLDNGSSRTVSVDYATASGSALPVEDYVTSSGKLTWDPGETEKTIILQIVNDRNVENNETFSLKLSNPCNASVSSSSSKTFTIQDNDCSLELNYTGNGKGIVVTDPDGDSFNSDTLVTLIADPVMSCDFIGWGGDASGVALSTDIVMDGPHSVSAGFDLKTFDIEVSAAPNGNITGIIQDIPYGQDAVLHIQGDPHYHLGNIIKNGAEITTPEETTSMDVVFREVKENGHTLQADFQIDHFTINAYSNENGNVFPESSDVKWGGSVQFSLDPQEHYHVEKVSVDGESINWEEDNRSYLFSNVSADHTIEADFAIDEYSLDISMIGDGEIQVSPDRELYSHGTEVKLHAVAAESMDFYSWDGDLSGTVNPVNLNMDGPKKITAIYHLKTFDISLLPDGHGTITGDTTVDWGSDNIFTIVPNSGYEVEDVKLDGISQGALKDLTLVNVTGSHVLSAYFRINSNMQENAGLEEFQVISEDEIPNYSESVDLPSGMAWEDIFNIDSTGLGVIAMDRLDQGYVEMILQNLEGKGDYFQGVSLDIAFSMDQYTAVLPIVLTMEVSKDLAGADHEAVIARDCVEDLLGHVFHRYISLIFFQEPDLFDLFGEALDQNSPAEAERFFEISSDDQNYYVKMNLILADSGYEDPEFAVQTVKAKERNWFFILDGQKDGHFIAKLATLNRPLEYVINLDVGEHGRIFSGDREICSRDMVLPFGSALSLDIRSDENHHISVISLDSEVITEAAGEREHIFNLDNVSYDHFLQAGFDIDHFTITALGIGHGIIDPCSMDVTWGENALFEIIPEPNYHQESFFIDGQPASFDRDQNTVVLDHVSDDHCISAGFVLDEHSINISVTGDGVVEISPDLGCYPHGSRIQLEAIEKASTDFCCWLGDLEGITEKVDMIMDKPVEINAVFQVKSFPLDLNYGDHGNIIGPERVNWGEDVLLTIDPDIGYEIDSIRLDGSSVLLSKTIELKNVKEGHNISVSFKMDQNMKERAGISEFTVISHDHILKNTVESLDLPAGITSESFDMIPESNIQAVAMKGLNSSDVKPVFQNRVAEENFIHGVSFDIVFNSENTGIGLMPLEIEMEISKNALGVRYCSLIEESSSDKGLASSFLDYVGIIKVLSPDVFDLLEEAWEKYPEDVAKSFFTVSEDQVSYYAGVHLLVADEASTNRDMTVQARVTSDDRYFFLLDGERDGHFKDPLVIVKKPVNEVSDRSYHDGYSCSLGFLSEFSILLLIPLFLLLK